MTNSKNDRCTRYDGEDGTVETLGDALGPGVTTDTLADTERVLQRFKAVADDEFEGSPEWLQTAHSAVHTALREYNSELGDEVGEFNGYNYAEHCRDEVIDAATEKGTTFASCGAYTARQNADGSVEVYELTALIQNHD